MDEEYAGDGRERGGVALAVAPTGTPTGAPVDGRNAAPYTDLAGVYDRLMADIEYDEWAAFIVRTAARRGLPSGSAGSGLLDLGCGTGNATLPMWELGYEVEGLDASSAMLAAARKKLPGIVFHLDTFEEFSLGRRFQLVYSVFDALNNLLTEAAFARCLARVRDHLVPGGVFMFDVNTPTGLRELWLDGVSEGWADDVYYRWTHTYDEESGLATVEAYCETGEGSFVEVHQERGYATPDLVRLLAAAGFADVAVIEYPDGQPARPDAERVWVVASSP